ncbi:serine hydrolase [Maribellus mangrovi]|uniref:serine hydrolase n=1 Tax=Maribellus mangrovi TaxID=3133146 RepID=UPI0030EBE5B7
MKRNIILPFLLIAFLCFCQTATLSAQHSDIQKKVDDYINAYVQMKQFSGSILIAKDGQVLSSKGYGKSSYQFDVENTPQTKFRIGSLTKGFTAVCIMQLVEHNKLSLDDKLIKFIPDYPRGDDITIKHLLTCTSGIPNHTEFEDFDNNRRVFHFTISETIETFKSKKLKFNPGEKFKYSNSNYILLGLIIEQISNMPYADYIEENIFEPLKMENSGFEKPENVINNMAQGYCFRNNEIVNAKFRNMSNASASGALYSTVEDLYIWDRALYTEKLITKKSLETIFTPFKDNYAFGWGVVNIFNHKMITHSGEIDGFTSNISRFTDDDICTIILSNFEQIPISRINKDLIAIVFGEDYKIPEVINTIKLSDDIMQSYVGEYELKPGFIFTVSVNNGSLFCQPTGQPKLELLPVSESEFILKEVEAKISFLKNSSQKVEKLILNQGGHQIPALRVN